MIKGIIEKIILNTFGKFIKGIEKDKLSVDLFSGNFKLQDISLNHEFFDSLNTPFTLAYSSIGKLHLQASISKLSSTPVQCVLDNIYAILQFKEGCGQTLQTIKSKKQKIFKQVGQVLESTLKKIKEEKKQDGMMARLGKKIVDNLQLKIMNVHLRFQEGGKFQNYAWGVTLEEINFTTTDQNWKPCFIERSGEGDQKLYKMMQVKKLNLYWQSGLKCQQDLLKHRSFNQKAKKQRLSQLIKKQANVVISITSSFKLIINSPEDTQSPLYELALSLQPLKFQLQRIQILQMRDFAKKNVMQNELIVKSMSKKSKIKISQQEKQAYKEKYQQFIKQVLVCQESNRALGSIEGYDEMLKEIFGKFEESQINLWSIGPVKKKVKQIRQNQLKKKKGGWFSRNTEQLSQQEKDQLQRFIDESFQAQKFKRQPHLLFFRINTELKGGKMILVQYKGQDIEQKIEFNIGKIITSIAKSEDQSYFQADLEVESINLNLYIPVQKNNITKKRKMQIFTTEKPEEYRQDSEDEDSMKSFDSQDSQQNQKTSFLKLVYKSQLLENKTVQKKTITGNMERVTVIYKRIYMQKFKKFFSFKKANTNMMKTAHIEQYESFIEQESTQQNLQTFKLQKILDVKLDINSPVFICPLNENQCWCLYFGSLNIKSNRKDGWQQYPMIVNSAFLRYYPFIKECYNLKDSRLKKGIYSLVNDIDFQINYQKDKDKNEEIITIDLPSFKVNFTQKQYENLMSLTKIFKVEEDQKRTMVQILKQERKQIEQNKNFEGAILKKHQTLMSWRLYYGILSGQYLYLYNDKKELKQNCKFFMKNAKLVFIQNQGEQNRQIELVNQDEIWYLSCQNNEELNEWYGEFDKKCKSFKTIHQLIKDYESSVDRNIKKNTQSECHSNDLNLSKRKILRFTVSEVEFSYKNQQEEGLLQFTIQDIFFSRQSQHDWSEKLFKMKRLLITDRIHRFNNKVYQKLIEAQSVSYQQLKGRKKLKGKRKTNIKFDVKDIFINWKPDVLLILMQLADKHFKTEKIHRVDDDIQQSREDHFKNVQNDTKFMIFMEKYKQKGKNIFVKEKRDQLSLRSSWMKETMETEVFFDKIEVNMIHRESHLLILKMDSNKIYCFFEVCQTAKFVKGTIHALDLYDMTGYPQKEYSPNHDYEPYRIMRKSPSASKDEPFMQYRWSAYQQNSFPNEEQIDSFMWVTIAPLQYEYYQQVTFRLVDYMLIQIILLINQPEMLTVNQNLMEQLKHSVNVQEKPIKVLFSKYEEVIKKLIHPSFMDMYFKLAKPTFIFKAEKTSHIYYKLTMQEMTFYNKTSKNGKRFQKYGPELKNLIYQDEYIIDGKDCRFIEMVENRELGSLKEQELFEPFKIEINFNKLINEDEINLLYPQISDYDRSFVTINKISEISIPHYSRLQYLNINKLVNFNFTFDDQNDQLFIHNFKITKLLSPKPIVYLVIIPQIYMIADYNAKENSEQIWKLFKVTIHNFCMNFRRSKQLDSSFTIQMGLTEMTGYEYQQGRVEPKEHQLLTFCGEEITKTSTDVLIQNRNTGQKIIQMNVNEMNVNVRTGLLQLVFEYTLIEDWVFPQVNKYVPELIFYATVHKMNAELAEDPNFVASQLRKKKTSAKIINDVLNHKFNMATFRLEGVLCYKFHRKKDATIQEYQKKLERKQLSYADFQKMQAVSSMSVIFNTQIYRAWTFSSSKRKIIEKFTFTFQDKRFLKVADQNQCVIKTSAKRFINIDRWLMKLSFKDLILMMKILNQIGEQHKYIQYLNNKTGKNQMLNLNPSKQTESSSLQNLDLKIETVTFYLINSRRDTFIPILKININTVNLGRSNTFKKDILKGDIAIGMYYFNNTIFRWQPVIERVTLFFHKLLYFQEVNRIFGSFESEGPIMINLSRQVFSSIKETADAWKKQSQQMQNKFNLQSKQVEPLEFISHYIVRNQTGYPIELLNDKNVLIKRINHDEQIDYELQIGNYDQQDRSELFVGFRLLHPKYKFLAVKNISFNSEKEYQILPRLMGEQNSAIPVHSKIVIKPEIRECKKVLMIKSCKYVYNYFDGQCQIKALPFDHDTYYVLPKEIHNQLKVSLYEEKVTEYYRYVGKDGVLKIMKKNLIYNYSPIPLQICGKIVKPDDYVGISQKLRIQDKDYKDSLLKVMKNQKEKEYYIYAECYIVDYYGLLFEFEKDSKNILKMYSHEFNQGGCRYTVYILPQAEFKFKVKMDSNSNSVNLKTTIGKINFTLQNKKSLCPFTLYSYLSSIENKHINEFRRIIEITPQYMLSNATKSLIKICQVQSIDSMTLQPYQRMPFVWQNKAKPKMIKLAYYDGVDFWGWSGELSIQKSTQTIVLRKMSDPTTYRILTIQIQITNTVTFIHIIQPSPKYILKNSIPGATLMVYQTAIMDQRLDLQHNFPKQLVYKVGYQQQKPFGYELPLQSHQIQARVELDQSRPEFKGLRCDPVVFDDFQTTIDSRSIIMRNQQKKAVGRLELILGFENNIKKLKLQVQKDEQQSENTYEYIIKIPQIGISFIGTYKQMRKEVLHMMLNTIAVEMSGNADYSDLNLVINGCRIENELKYNAIFPVIFESDISQTAKYFINFRISQSARNPRLIHYIGCSINKSRLTMTSEELQVMQENMNRIVLFNDDGESNYIRRVEMFNSKLPDPQQSKFFVQSTIHPLKTNITFKHVNQWGGKLLKTFSSINECHIGTQGLKFKNFSCANMGAYFSHLFKHYQDGLSKMILPMIGNLTILGSPITFVQKIGSGFKDLVELPVQGFQISALQGGKGVGRGMKSFIGKTISGTFNSVESITVSLSNGITLLVDDDRTFARERQNIKNDKSQHVFGGLANGAKSIAYGFKNGFTGLFTQPVQGAEKSGLPGFLLGAAKGIGGLVIKPISGVIDAASKTAQGIKNTPQYLSGDRKQKLSRQHNPRPFYYYYKQFRNYDFELAEFIKILEQQNSQKYSNLSWCGHYELKTQKPQSLPFLILSYEFMFIYDLKKKKLVQHLKCQNFISINLSQNNAIRIKLWDKKTNREGFVTFVPESGCKKIASEISAIIRHFSPNFIFD